MDAIEYLYDRYRWLVERDQAGQRSFDPTGDPYAYVTEACAAWLGRYLRQKYLIDHLPDEEQRRRVKLAGINADGQSTKVPDWTPEEWKVLHLFEQNLPSDQPLVIGLHAHGPSLRALWEEATIEGASHAEAWRYIWDWAHRPPAKGDFADEVFLTPPRPPAPPASPPPVYVPPPDLDPADLLPRYLAGEREQVWNDQRATSVQHGPGLRRRRQVRPGVGREDR